MNELLTHFRKDGEYLSLIDGFSDGRLPCIVNGLCDPARPFFIASLIKDLRKRGLVVVSEEKDAVAICELLRIFFDRVYFYPAREFVYENVSAYSKESEHERISVLDRCITGDFDVIVTVPDALMQFTVPAHRLSECSFELRIGQRAEPAEVVSRLAELGYARSDIVEGAGQFSVRGGILDVFTPGYDDPVRIDFFGNEIDLIGRFDTVSQRRVENMQRVRILPCTEKLPDGSADLALTREINSLLKNFTGPEKRRQTLVRDLEAIEKGERSHFSDRYYTLLYDRSETLLDYLGDEVRFVLDSKRVSERAGDFAAVNDGTAVGLAQAGLCRAKNCRPYCTKERFISSLGNNTVLVDLLGGSGREYGCKTGYSIVAKSVAPFTEKTDIFVEDASAYLESENTVFIVCGSNHSAANMTDLLSNADIPSYRFNGDYYESRIALSVLDGHLIKKGFELPKSRFVLMTDYLGARSEYQSKGRRRFGRVSKGERITSYADLTAGDLVVHVNHGIGRYCGIQNLVSQGISRDFIKIVYADNGILYVPCDQLDMVSKYVGSETTKLSKMGGAEWKRAKARARASASNIAKELIRLYAERRSRTGFSFPPDDELQDEFEAGFEYAETEGQTIAAKEIKKDMENPYPMDRLLCGDVGFGKTEVSLRAIFKCVFSGKQAAFLVPTTILAYQHYQTVMARFRGYPVRVAMLSRFVTKKEQGEIIKKLSRGEIDIVIGTHRLLQKDIEFRDLGLLVVDEEQRFGVTHKEKLKELARGVDVLTLTATPIPRTLNMALSGIRDMSVLEEAPTDRVPVQTFVLEHDEAMIAEAIRRELRRGGQVFYLHNFVDSIYSKASKIATEFPDSTVAVAHGQMDKEMLSDVWNDMVEGKIDILVCTTIIESGINVPNANTLVIEDSDRMGLSQLHQIRGRVGRSARKAYAYFTYRPDKAMNEIAEKRLEAIREFTEFGSGFKIAMRDLELRGAGSLLGAEQSGHLEAIGYDLYIKILEDAINAEKGIIEPKAERNCSVDILCNAFVPEKYISSSAMRIDIYKKIAILKNMDEFDDLCDELNDRFGDIPVSVSNLMRISLIRNMAMECGFTSIEQNTRVISLYTPRLNIEQCAVLASEDEFKGSIMLSAGNRPHIAYRLRENETNLDATERILSRYLKLLQN